MDLQRNRKNKEGAASLIDKETFCGLINLHEKAMYYLAFSLVRNEADAADVIGEAILRAYKSIDALKSEKAFKPWLLKIIHNTAVEYIRKNAKTVSAQEIDIGVENDIETKLTLWQTVKSLNQPYRTVTILYYYEDLSISEISKITDTSVIAVKQQLSRARKQLRELLKEDFVK